MADQYDRYGLPAYHLRQLNRQSPKCADQIIAITGAALSFRTPVTIAVLLSNKILAPMRIIFMYMHKPIFKNTDSVIVPVPEATNSGNELRLHIRREGRMGRCMHVNRLQFSACHIQLNQSSPVSMLAPGFPQFHQNCFHDIGPSILHSNTARVAAAATR